MIVCDQLVLVLIWVVQKLDNKVNKGVEEKLSKSRHDMDKLKGDLKEGMSDVQQTIVTLQKVSVLLNELN